MTRSTAIRMNALNGEHRHKKPIPITRIHDAVADLAEETELCVTFLPKGVPIQLFYEDFCLARAFMVESPCQEITLILDALPQFIENEYLLATSNGDFDLYGQLWLSPTSLRDINQHRRFVGQRPYLSVEKAIGTLINTPIMQIDNDLLRIRNALCFTPTWSDQLTKTSVVATYDDFLGVMETNFPMEENHLLTVKTIDNLIPIYQAVLGYNDAHPYAPIDAAELQSVIVCKNHLQSRPNTISHDYLIVADIAIEQTPIEVVIDIVNIEPDRFGYLRPMIGFEEVSRHQDDLCFQSLPTIAELYRRSYKEGDVVEVRYVGGVPHLGPVIRNHADPAPADWGYSLRKGLCESCQQKLTIRQGGLRCDNPFCMSINLYRVLYACAPNVLDIPFDSKDLFYLCVSSDYPITLPSLLTFGKSDLQQFLPNSEINAMVETLRTRRNQLHGIGYQQDVQSIAQKRFLDAISIAGLHRKNIQRLQTRLVNKDWYWGELHQVLTRPNMLRRFGLDKHDALDIAEQAKHRQDELQAYAEL